MNLTTGPLKILIVRFSSIGDIVLTSPVIRCLKEQLPGAEIHYLTKKPFAHIPGNNPHVSKVYALEDKLAPLIPLLKSEKYDYIIDLHNNLRSWYVKLRLQVRSSSFNKLNLEKWLLVNLKKDLLPPIHIVDRYMETVMFLKVYNDGKGLNYFIPPADEVNAASLPASHQNGYIAFAIGAQHATKRLPLHKIIEICRNLDTPVILLGGKDEQYVAGQVVQHTGAVVFNACGMYNLNQSASLIRQADAVISHDTGLMHIAAALRKKIISVWGNTVPEFGMYPYRAAASHIIEVKGLPCRPCSKIGYAHCPRGHFKCMELIDTKKIVSLLTN